MELHRFVPSFLRNQWSAYCSLPSKDHFFLWLSYGIFLGSTLGYIAHHDRVAHRTSDHMEVSLFRVDKDNIKPFEVAWNDLSRLSQMQLGYEWTKMFKAIAWEQSPYQYISVRMWGRSKYASDFEKSRDYPTTNSQIESAASSPIFKGKFVSVVDDSVVRLIH
jgi:hypothetical protein